MKRKSFYFHLLTLIVSLPFLSCQKEKRALGYIGRFHGTYMTENGNAINKTDSLLFVLNDCGKDYVDLALARKNTETGRLEIKESCSITRDGNHIEGIIPYDAIYDFSLEPFVTYWRNSIFIIGEMILDDNIWTFEGEYRYDFSYWHSTYTEEYHVIGNFEIVPL